MFAELYAAPARMRMAFEQARAARQAAEENNEKWRRAYAETLRMFEEAYGPVIDVETREVPDVLLLTWNGR